MQSIVPNVEHGEFEEMPLKVVHGVPSKGRGRYTPIFPRDFAKFAFLSFLDCLAI